MYNDIDAIINEDPQAAAVTDEAGAAMGESLYLESLGSGADQVRIDALDAAFEALFENCPMYDHAAA